MKIKQVHTLVLGSGAAGLAAAVRLDSEGVDDVVILTEGLDKGTSINTGSDKQTYYKLGMCGATPDSPRALAETYLTMGGADGDLALVEASVSTRAFFHLVNLGVPFPHDSYGQYAGYKTDHDPAKRATSCGPYTSREMCLALIREVKRRKIPVYEGQTAVRLVAKEIGTEKGVPRKRVTGVIAIDSDGEPWLYRVKNVVFAVGGPGGLYKTSVYPEVHTGAIGLALQIGALAKGLPESQFGMASFTDVTNRNVRVPNAARPKEFRWNVSGTFMQAIPKFVSTEQDGVSNPCEFLFDYFDDLGDLFGRVFLKGYQWPFDVRKAVVGSSFIDLCVFYETAIKGRRVFLDYRDNPRGFNFDLLPKEAFDYLRNSDALLTLPFDRLQKMNPNAIELYRDWGIDLASEPLEIGLCAQHNNGGLAVDCWWRSLNIEGLYPIGEVAGTHGVGRPGGSALNAGQVGAFRAAERIGYEYRLEKTERFEEKSSDSDAVYTLDEYVKRLNLSRGDLRSFVDDVAEVVRLMKISACAKQVGNDWRKERAELKRRMSESAGVFRSRSVLTEAASQARKQFARLTFSCHVDTPSLDDRVRFDSDDVETLRNVQLAVSQITYMDAILICILSRVGSRGSALILSPDGKTISSKFPTDWKMQDENVSFHNKIIYTHVADLPSNGELTTNSFWRDAKPIPETDEWFENVWRDYREGVIFGETP